MGNSASKARTLPRAAIQQSKVAVTRAERPEQLRPTEASVVKEQELAERLRSLGSIQVRTTGLTPRPATEDGFTNTLKSREKVAQTEDAQIAAQSSGAAKQLVTTTEMVAIVSAMGEGVSREKLQKTFGLAPEVVDKLAPLRALTSASGRRRRRNA